MDDLSNVTIIVPTYNRPIFLRRLLQYHRKYKVKCKFIIADSSIDQIKNENEKTVSSFSDLDISYKNNFNSDINPTLKMKKVIDMSTTPYSLLCADDDFTSSKAIKTCMEFLENNNDYICAGGEIFCFFTRRRKKENQFYWNEYLQHKKQFMNLAQNNAEDRLIYHFSNYFPTIYYVYRTDFLKLIHNELIANTNDVRFGELLPAMLAVTYGKVKTFDIFYGARDYNPLSTGSTSSKITDFVNDGTYDEKYLKFRKCIVGHLIKNNNLEHEKAEVIIDRGMEIYLSKLIKRQQPIKLRSYIKIFLVNLTQYEKISFKQRINLNNWKTTLHSQYKEDFNMVKKIVLEFDEI